MNERKGLWAVGEPPAHNYIVRCNGGEWHHPTERMAHAQIELFSRLGYATVLSCTCEGTR